MSESFHSSRRWVVYLLFIQHILRLLSLAVADVSKLFVAFFCRMTSHALAAFRIRFSALRSGPSRIMSSTFRVFVFHLRRRPARVCARGTSWGPSESCMPKCSSARKVAEPACTQVAPGDAQRTRVYSLLSGDRISPQDHQQEAKDKDVFCSLQTRLYLDETFVA